MAKMNYGLNHSRSINAPYSTAGGLVGLPGTSKKRKRKKHNKVRLVSKFGGTCAVCVEPYAIGETVWYDSAKEAGKKCAHHNCWSPKRKNR